MKPQPYPDHVWSKRLAPRRYPLRPMPDSLLFRHCVRHRHLLALMTSLALIALIATTTLAELSTRYSEHPYANSGY
jgi:hypothetical protein